MLICVSIEPSARYRAEPLVRSTVVKRRVLQTATVAASVQSKPMNQTE